MKKVSNRILLQKSISRSKSSKEDVKLSDLYVEGERRYNKVLLVKSPATLWSGGGGSINANIAETEYYFKRVSLARNRVRRM